MKGNQTLKKYILLNVFFIAILSFKSFSQTQLEAGDFNLCVKNIIQGSSTTIQFDIYLEWDNPSKANRLNYFQGGMDFDYASLANGGTITGAFVSGSADPSLPPVQKNPNWNVNQTSKQIRMLAAIALPASAATIIPGYPGIRLGTFKMTNTVPFASVQPNFVWSFVTGSNKTQTKEAFYLDGSPSAAAYVDQQPYPNHCPIIIFCPCCNSVCFSPEAGGPYSSCGDIHLNGTLYNAPVGTWTSSGTGTFDPNNTTLNATYHPSALDITNGSVILTLTSTNYGTCCGPLSSNTGATFNSIDDNNICTVDGCDQTSGNSTHTLVSVDDGISCTEDGCNSITGVFHTTVNCLNVTLYSNIFLEGYYKGGGLMNNCLFATGLSLDPTDADYITISVMNPSPPYGLVDSKTAALKTNGDVTVTFNLTPNPNNNYYIKVTHRNTITTWSSVPFILSSQTTYIFSEAASRAFGSNQIGTHLVGEPSDGFGFAFYSGDIGDGNPPGSGVQDGSIDATDYLDLEPHIQNGDSGYIIADMNGDGSVDATDFLIMGPNIYLGIGTANP